MISNPDFYPTPRSLAIKMISKIKGDPQRILEPSAGKGDIIETLEKDRGYRRSHDMWAIESDPELQATLLGKGIKLLDSDFLSFSGPDKFDLIIGNPPFSNGHKHLLKAIDMMYNGQIIFLLNAQTIRNPNSRMREELVKKLNNLGASIEYIDGAFKDAERPTGVEVALVDVRIENKIEEELFKGVDEKAPAVKVELEDNHEVSTGRRVEELVLEYNQVIHIATETILSYFKNHKKIGKYIGLNKEAGRNYSDKEGMTKIVEGVLNSTIIDIRKDFWYRTLDLPEVVRRLTAEKKKEFDETVQRHSFMDFTERNIRTFILNLIGGYKDSVRDSILKLFDKFTFQHTYREVPWEKNIHYFNGWKTNKAFYINKKIVLPVHGGYGEGPFRDYGRWKLGYQVKDQLQDIDIVLNYFDGMEPGYLTISNALDHAFKVGINETNSTYFSKIVAYKKGTLHLTFRDDDILRRFNIEACKGKGWLPENYGETAYNQLGIEMQKVVDSFEGKSSYNQNLGKPTLDFSCGIPKLEAA